LKGAMIVAEEVRRNIEVLNLPHKYSSVANYLTLSLGVAILIPSNSNSIKDFINEADKALYKAKSSGRNTVNPFLVAI